MEFIDNNLWIWAGLSALFFSAGVYCQWRTVANMDRHQPLLAWAIAFGLAFIPCWLLFVLSLIINVVQYIIRSA